MVTRSKRRRAQHRLEEALGHAARQPPQTDQLDTEAERLVFRAYLNDNDPDALQHLEHAIDTLHAGGYATWRRHILQPPTRLPPDSLALHVVEEG